MGIHFPSRIPRKKQPFLYTENTKRAPAADALKPKTMALRKATRQKAKIRLAISGPSGAGKTMSSLLIAYGLCGDWDKIAVIDTENNSADLYAHLGDYNVLPIEPPFTTEKYIKAIAECETAQMEVIIIDSASHEWQGQGGILESVDNFTASSTSKNAFSTGWKEMTPKHNRFMNAMLHSKCHVIACLRSKQDYQLVEENGKKVPKKMGLNPIQRDGVEYEFTVHLDMSMNNHATALKDRTGLYKDNMPFKPTTETGEQIREWCENGVDPSEMVKDAISKLDKCDTIEELTLLKETLPTYVLDNGEFKTAGIKRFNAINNAKKPLTNAN